jgi:8-oxo-dGTP pyrophosphatase MutT (NUDIX family)
MKNNMEETYTEYVDLLDKQRNFTGKTHKRNDPFPNNTLRLIVVAWVVNSNGYFLITKRALNNNWYPGIWEVPGGSVLAGEDSLTAAIREVKEETGLLLRPENAELFCSYQDGPGKYNTAFFDHWLFIQDFNLADVKFQEGETMDARIATWEEIQIMKERGECVGRKILNTNFDAFDLLKKRFAM